MISPFMLYGCADIDIEPFVLPAYDPKMHLKKYFLRNVYMPPFLERSIAQKVRKGIDKTILHSTIAGLLIVREKKVKFKQV